MEIGAAEERKRVNLDFSPDAYAQLQAMKEREEKKTIVSVISNSLRLYGWWLDREKEGYTIEMVREKDGVLQVQTLDSASLQKKSEGHIIISGSQWSISIHPIIARFFRFIFRRH